MPLPLRREDIEEQKFLSPQLYLFRIQYQKVLFFQKEKQHLLYFLEVKMKNNKKLVLSALFLAIALVLPFLTGQIPEIGSMLCPMHIPVLLCGFFCGWQYGLAVGFVAPLLRSFLFGVPYLYPMAVSMAFELAVYGCVSGAVYQKTKRSIYPALLCAMVLGRIAWGTVRFLCAGLDVSKFGLAAFWSGAVTAAIPGIVLQLILIPALVYALDKRGVRQGQ